MADGCYCDDGAPCEDPECVAEREAEMERQRQIYNATPRMSREEWADVYRDDPAKAAAYPW